VGTDRTEIRNRAEERKTEEGKTGEKQEENYIEGKDRNSKRFSSGKKWGSTRASIRGTLGGE